MSFFNVSKGGHCAAQQQMFPSHDRFMCSLGKTSLLDVIGSSFIESDSKLCYREVAQMEKEIIFES